MHWPRDLLLSMWPLRCSWAVGHKRANLKLSTEPWRRVTNFSALTCLRHMKRDSTWRSKSNRYDCSLRSWWNLVVVLFFQYTTSTVEPLWSDHLLSGHPLLSGQFSVPVNNQPALLSGRTHLFVFPKRVFYCPYSWLAHIQPHSLNLKKK